MLHFSSTNIHVHTVTHTHIHMQDQLDIVEEDYGEAELDGDYETELCSNFVTIEMSKTSDSSSSLPTSTVSLLEKEGFSCSGVVQKHSGADSTHGSSGLGTMFSTSGVSSKYLRSAVGSRYTSSAVGSRYTVSGVGSMFSSGAGSSSGAARVKTLSKSGE